MFWVTSARLLVRFLNSPVVDGTTGPKKGHL